MTAQSTAKDRASQIPSLPKITELSALPDDVALLKQMVSQLLEQVHDKTRENFDLKCQLDWLKRQLFGRKSEKLDPNQRLLFEDMFKELEAQLEQQPEEHQDKIGRAHV